MSRFSVAVVIALLTGFLVGKYHSLNPGSSYEWTLYLLIFLVGVDIGLGLDQRAVKRTGYMGIFLATATLVGSIAGGLIGGAILGVPLNYGGAIGSGCGWYSITGPIIAQYSPVYGTLGFLSNLLREILTFLLYPFLITILPKEAAITIGGATTMDTTFGLIAKEGGRETGILAFVHGFILTMVVPFVIPLFL